MVAASVGMLSHVLQGMRPAHRTALWYMSEPWFHDLRFHESLSIWINFGPQSGYSSLDRDTALHRTDQVN